MASLGDAIHRPALLDRVFRSGLRSRLQSSGPLMLDSGGFTLITRGSNGLTVNRLAELYAACEADLYIALDEPAVAGDGLAVRAAKHEATLRNLERLAAILPGNRPVPVIHGPELHDIARNAARTREIVPGPRLIALGGLVPRLRYSGINRNTRAAAQVHISAAVGITHEAFPNSGIHVLGAGAPRTMLNAFASGAYSVDSVGWRRAAGFGTVFVSATAGERFVEDRARRRPHSRKQLSERDRYLLSTCDCPACGPLGRLDERLALLSCHYIHRAAHNAWTLHREARLYRTAKQ